MGNGAVSHRQARNLPRYIGQRVLWRPFLCQVIAFNIYQEKTYVASDHSNDALLTALSQTTTPAVRITLGATPAVEAYALDQKTLPLVAAHETDSQLH